MWTVNATDVEWVECEHINKIGSILQLETHIIDLTNQLKLATEDNEPQKQEIQTNLENQTYRLMKVMSEQKFKLGPEHFSPIISLKLYNTFSKKKTFQCK